MTGRVPVIACENFFPEVERFLRESRLTGRVELHPFTAKCRSAMRPTPSGPIDRPFADGSPGELEPIVIGGLCARSPASRSRLSRELGDSGSGGCFGLIAPDWLLANLIREGGYLVSPGWLVSWELHVREWGFAPADLLDFAKESMKRICLLDTLVMPGSESRMEAMARSLGLPSIRIPVGMDHCGERLRAIIGSRLELPSGAESRDGGAEAIHDPRPAADYAMALDLLGRLNQFQSEVEVIGRLLDIFAMLFAPGKMCLVRFAAGSPVAVNRPFQAESPVDGETMALCAELASLEIVADYGTGLALPLDFNGERLGLLVLEDLAQPERRRAYGNLLESIAPICSLSLENARNYAAIVRGEAALRSKQEDLQRMLGVRDRLFAIIGHDLRGPIGGMRDALRGLVDDLSASLPADDALMLTEVAISAERIYFLLSNLLEWGKSQRSSIELKPGILDVRELAEDVFALMRGQAIAKRIEFRNAVDPRFEICADLNSMETILRNLVSNALKFTPSGGSVTIRSEEEAGEKRIVVADTGIGMDADHLAHALDFSERRSSPGTDGERGTGLGLILCEAFTEKNGGAIRIASEPGRGTTVSLVFESEA